MRSLVVRWRSDPAQRPHDQIGLTRDLTAVLRDPRDPQRVHFTCYDLLKQRVLHIATGYADANDATTLRHDPIFKLLLDRLPETGPLLASQPTISRFENREYKTLALVHESGKH